MLWVGWFGFNGGSALAANGQAAMAVVVTQISPCIAALTWIIIEWFKNGKPSALGFATGAIAGPCGYYACFRVCRPARVQ